MSVAVDAKVAEQAVKTIKFLAADAVEKANSGHPGMPMGTADIAFVLWSRFLRYDPTAPDWPDRDRFVLSAGHGSMLLYGMLHLAGYDLPMSELKAFRQWDSRTPGHPEFGHTVGVEATTGPLGQGISNAVGMAVAARMLAARFNTGDFDPITHRIFTIASDGDLMEGVSCEASSLAGHLGLGNLIVMYDDNEITIEGGTNLAFSEDVAARYAAYGWHTQSIDGHDHDAIARALETAIGEPDRPSIVCCRTTIAHGAPNKQGTSGAHGSPLGADELAATKEALGWPAAPSFLVPDDVRDYFRARAEEGAALRTAWERRFDAWREADPARGREWTAVVGRQVPADITDQLLANAPDNDAATRAHGGAVLQQAALLVPGLVGGSADLEPSTKTRIKDSPSIARGAFIGRNFHFGIREHAMGAMLNGMAYHGSFVPYGSTFLVFADYMRPPIRLAALSHLQAIYVFTHDSIFVGEDGPTHQPIEQAASLRAIPGVRVFRPADGYETALAWGMALEHRTGPTAMLLTRQKVPALNREAQGDLADPKRGAYLIAGDAKPDALIVATGSEVHLAVAARKALAADGKKVNVVSAPCLEVFEEQDPSYRLRLLPQGVPVASIEAGITQPWKAVVGRDALTIGIDRYGASAPGDEVARRLGLSADGVIDRVREWLG